MSDRPRLKILVADDHGLYRAGLVFLLKDQIHADEVLEVGGFDQALDRLASDSEISVALFDLSMPGMTGPESLAVVRETYPSVKVAVVSGSEDRDLVLRALSVGLSGYIPKSLGEAEIADAIRMVVGGQIFVPPFLAAASATKPAGARPADTPDQHGTAAQVDSDRLTPRQRDVLKCVVRGLSNKEVARELDIAEGTVKIHLAALFVHFGVRNRTELATKAHVPSR